MLDRKGKLTKKINLSGRGLELGPLCWPVLTKAEANIQYVDHTTTEKIKLLYRGDRGVPQDQIVDIDYPLNGRSLKEAVGKKRFDYILASHVIEHVADVVGWLDEMGSVLKPGGILSLAIPDKRFTFDIDRNVSRPADVIGAHLDRLKKPSSVTMYDYFVNYRDKVDPRQAWAGQTYLTEAAAPHRYTPQDAVRYAEINRDTAEYVDAHCFVFTPSSFFDVVRELIKLSLLPFEIASFDDTAENEYEFFVALRKTAKSPASLLRTVPSVPPEPSLRSLRGRIDDLEDQLANHQRQLEHVLTSVSWRITRPIRIIRGWLGKLRA